MAELRKFEFSITNRSFELRSMKTNRTRIARFSKKIKDSPRFHAPNKITQLTALCLEGVGGMCLSTKLTSRCLLIEFSRFGVLYTERYPADRIDVISSCFSRRRRRRRRTIDGAGGNAVSQKTSLPVSSEPPFRVFLPQDVQWRYRFFSCSRPAKYFS